MEQATVSAAGGRLEIKVMNRILSAGQAIRPSGYILASKNKYDSLILRVAYRVDGNLREVSHTFTVGLREEEKPPFQFQELPVAFTSINYINWYGNTEFAYRNRTGIYKELQGLHSGIDFIAPCETPIKSVVNRSGKVVSINNEPPVARAGPGSILIDYDHFLVLYGHTQKDKRPEKIKLNAVINPNDTIAYVGSDAKTDGCDTNPGLIHLHLEVIRKKPSERIRTNPVPFFSSTALKQLKDKAEGIGATFHPIAGGKWQTPEDQPDITPGGRILVP